MSFYNIIKGFDPTCLLILPMLGKKPEEYPRFRDCFITDDNNIAIYTRVGGNNRNSGYGEELLYSNENFITTYDDDYDNTYAIFEFNVPEKWKTDFDNIVAGNIKMVSDEYMNYLNSFYPKLAKKDVFRKLFRGE